MKPHCRETLQRAYLYLDGELLNADQRLEIEQHLAACRPCYERLGLEQEVAALVARLRHQCRCPEGLKARITSLLEEA